MLVTGNARRPVTAGDFTLSFFPGERLTVTNSTAVHSTRMDGDAAYTQLDNSTLTSQSLYFRYLGIRTISNATDLNFRATGWLGFYTGYHYSTRRIRYIESFALPTFPADTGNFEQENTLNSGLLGIRITPVKPLAINLEGEIGRADGPFTPISERDYHALRARVQYRRRSILLAGVYRQNYNNNSVTLSTHSLRSRQYSASGTWTPRGWFALDAGYMKLHLDTVSGLAFFAGAPAGLADHRLRFGLREQHPRGQLRRALRHLEAPGPLRRLHDHQGHRRWTQLRRPLRCQLTRSSWCCCPCRRIR